MNCRHCNCQLTTIFCDLSTCPPSNAMVDKSELCAPETYFPLSVSVCSNCYLVQVEEIEKAENIFNEKYTYFSSYSTSWLAHSKKYVDEMVPRFKLTSDSLVVEVASNDGYLLQYFKELNIPVIGVEPTSNTALQAEAKGIETMVDFFGSSFAKENLKAKADLILGNNVLAHVPDINDFVKGVKIALKPNGINTFEFPHICKLISLNQFDTIYHEHFSYLSLTVIKRIFNEQGLEIFDVQELSTHGGSLRVFSKHTENIALKIEDSVMRVLEDEKKLGIESLEYYAGFQEKVYKIKNDFLTFLIKQYTLKKKVIGYGAAAKGNTLINFAGVKGTELIHFVADASPHKQGKYLPGSRICVLSPSEITKYRPDFIIIFPWNLKDEICTQLQFVREWGAKFVTFIPEMEIF